ncbi:hypothetical protein ACFE04_024002 [Oxalis oulophora]
MSSQLLSSSVPFSINTTSTSSKLTPSPSASPSPSPYQPPKSPPAATSNGLPVILDVKSNLEDTSSFKDLDDHSKNVLKRLYYDYYFHRQENMWRENSLKTLPVLLNFSDMLACGKDLVLIPNCVHPGNDTNEFGGEEFTEELDIRYGQVFIDVTSRGENPTI